MDLTHISHIVSNQAEMARMLKGLTGMVTNAIAVQGQAMKMLEELVLRSRRETEEMINEVEQRLIAELEGRLVRLDPGVPEVPEATLSEGVCGTVAGTVLRSV